MRHDILDDDETLGAEDELTPESDEMDFAEHIKRLNPTADQLQHFATLRSMKQAQLAAVAPPVQTNPPSSINGTLGQQVVVIGTDITPKQVAFWPGDDTESRPVSIAFAPVGQLSDQAQPFGLRPYGIIQFGTRGALVTAEVDIGTGIQLCVPASQVTLQVALEEPAGAPAGATMKLSGSIAWQPVVRTTPVTRTRYIDNIATLPAYHGNSHVVKVPAFSRSFRYWQNGVTNTAADITFDMLDSFGNVAYSVNVLAADRQAIEIDLAGDVVYVAFEATTVANGSGRMIFDLAF